MGMATGGTRVETFTCALKHSARRVLFRLQRAVSYKDRTEPVLRSAESVHIGDC